MPHMPTVKTVMTPFPHAVRWEDSVATAVTMMEEHSFHHLPVTRDGELIGVLSEADLRVFRALARNDTPELPVGLICDNAPYVVDLNTSLPRVTDELVRRQVSSALVTRGGELCGIVTVTDICRYMSELLRAHFAPSMDDDVA